MANNMGAAVGAPPQGDGNQRLFPVPQIGASATVVSGAASADIALPTDAAGNAYRGYFVTASQAAWITFGTAAQTAVAAAANNILLPANFFDWIVPPAGATHVAGIQDTAAGKVCFVGAF
jgi:hypothetical protein